jgi:ABC-type transport system substrate-binding protein
MPFLSEYAAVLAQFRGKNIWVGGGIRTQDALELKGSFPELLMAQNEFTRGPMRMKFGIQDQNAPTADERVRQALSMLMNRELILDVLKEVEPMQAAGVPVEKRWHSSIPAGWDGYWLDPRGKDFGPNAQYYQYNVAEAKKLLTAAGYPNGFPLDFTFTTSMYGAAYLRYVETLAGEIESTNLIKVTRKPITYTEFLPVVVRGKGQYTGVSFQLWGAEPHPVEAARVQYHSQGGIGIDQPPFKPEPDVDDMIIKMTQEFDNNKIKTMLAELQRLLAKRQRTIPEPGDAPGLSVTWPWVGNALSYRGYDQFAGNGAERMPYLWVDESKRTT